MNRRPKTVVRKGQVYRLAVRGREYTIFIWQSGKQFCGSVDGYPQFPEQKGASAEAVRAEIASLLNAVI